MENKLNYKNGYLSDTTKIEATSALFKMGYLRRKSNSLPPNKILIKLFHRVFEPRLLLDDFRSRIDRFRDRAIIIPEFEGIQKIHKTAVKFPLKEKESVLNKHVNALLSDSLQVVYRENVTQSEQLENKTLFQTQVKIHNGEVVVLKQPRLKLSRLKPETVAYLQKLENRVNSGSKTRRTCAFGRSSYTRKRKSKSSRSNGKQKNGAYKQQNRDRYKEYEIPQQQQSCYEQGKGLLDQEERLRKQEKGPCEEEMNPREHGKGPCEEEMNPRGHGKGPCEEEMNPRGHGKGSLEQQNNFGDDMNAFEFECTDVKETSIHDIDDASKVCGDFRTDIVKAYKSVIDAIRIENIVDSYEDSDSDCYITGHTEGNKNECDLGITDNLDLEDLVFDIENEREIKVEIENELADTPNADATVCESALSQQPNSNQDVETQIDRGAADKTMENIQNKQELEEPSQNTFAQQINNVSSRVPIPCASCVTDVSGAHEQDNLVSDDNSRVCSDVTEMSNNSNSDEPRVDEHIKQSQRVYIADRLYLPVSGSSADEIKSSKSVPDKQSDVETKQKSNTLSTRTNTHSPDIQPILSKMADLIDIQTDSSVASKETIELSACAPCTKDKEKIANKENKAKSGPNVVQIHIFKCKPCEEMPRKLKSKVSNVPALTVQNDTGTDSTLDDKISQGETNTNAKTGFRLPIKKRIMQAIRSEDCQSSIKTIKKEEAKSKTTAKDKHKSKPFNRTKFTARRRGFRQKKKPLLKLPHEGPLYGPFTRHYNYGDINKRENTNTRYRFPSKFTSNRCIPLHKQTYTFQSSYETFLTSRAIIDSGRRNNFHYAPNKPVHHQSLVNPGLYFNNEFNFNFANQSSIATHQHIDGNRNMHCNDMASYFAGVYHQEDCVGIRQVAERSWSSWPRNDNSDSMRYQGVCSHCKRPTTCLCKGCFTVPFCSEICQHKAWQYHNKECNLIRYSNRLHHNHLAIPSIS